MTDIAPKIELEADDDVLPVLDPFPVSTRSPERARQLLRRTEEAFLARLLRERAADDWHARRVEELEAQAADKIAELDEPGQRRLRGSLRRKARRETKENLPHAGKPLRFQITGAAGLGKTRAFIEAYRNNSELWPLQIHYYVPDMGLAKEVEKQLNADAPAGMPLAVVMPGRTYPDGDTKPACLRADIVKLAEQKVASVFKSFCDDGNGFRCPYYDQCEYIREREDRSPRVRIYTHANLTLVQTEKLRPEKPDLVVIDEECRQSVVKHTRVDADALSDKRTFLTQAPTENDRIEANAHVQLGAHILALWKNGRDVADCLMREEGERISEHVRNGGALDDFAEADPQSLKSRFERAAAAADRAGTSIQIQPQDSDHVVRRKLDEMEYHPGRSVAAVLRQVKRDLGFGDSCAVEYVEGERGTRGYSNWPHIFCHGLRELSFDEKTPLLLLNADASLSVNRQIFCRGRRSELREIRILAKRRGEVVQCHDETFSTTALAQKPLPNSVDEREAGHRASARRQKIVDFALGLAERRKVFMAANKKVRCAITGEEDATELSYPIGRRVHVHVGHYGKLRGRNAFRRFDVAILLGRNEPTPIDIEREAQAIYGSDRRIKLCLPGRYVRARRSYGPGHNVSVAIWTHEDPRVRELLESVREREMCQAADRLRLLDQDERRPVIYILCSLPLPGFVPRELRTAKDILEGGSRIERAVESGFYTPNAKVLAGAYPNAWASSKAAEHSICREETPNLLKEDRFYAKWGFLSYAEFRISGTRSKWSSLWYDPRRCADPSLAIGAALKAVPIGLEMRRPVTGNSLAARIVQAAVLARRQLGPQVVVCGTAPALNLPLPTWCLGLDSQLRHARAKIAA